MINTDRSIGVKESEIIESVIIDVQNHTVTVVGNGEDIPTQKYTFTDSDEWFDIRNNDDEPVLSGNIFWDENWGFQYVDNIKLEDGKLSYGNDFRNCMKYFKDELKTPFMELDWVQTDIRKSKEGKTPVMYIPEISGSVMPYEFRGVVYGEDGDVESVPLDLIGGHEEANGKLDAIGLYLTLHDRTQRHLVDIDFEEMEKLRNIFLQYKRK
jgi:hypothetical protein